MKDFINFIKTWYVWLTLVIVFLVLIGWISISEVKILGKEILNKVESIEIDIGN